MNRLLVICPTMKRTQKCKDMLDSLRKTQAGDVDVILGLEGNSDVLPYAYLCEDYLCQAKIFHGDNITQIFNTIVKENLDYDYYMPMNDDFFFETPGWDEKLIQAIGDKPGFAYPNDMINTNGLPTTMIIDASIVRTLGWLQLPTLTHLFGDSVWGTIGRGAQCMTYVKDVIIEHRHPIGGKVDPDEVYLKTNSKDMYSKDSMEFFKWLSNKAAFDIETVKKSCGK